MNEQNSSVEETKTVEATPEVKLVPQDQVDRIVQDRLNRERAKYADYDELRNKVQTFEQQQAELNQKDLEAKSEYGKLKEGWEAKENEYKNLLNQKEQSIKSMHVGNALTNEILKQNAYPEAIELLKANAKFNDDGSVTLSGKDSNGMVADLTVEQGVKQFLEERPYLVKANANGGGGTQTQGTTAVNQGNRDLISELQVAQRSGDRQKVKEIKDAMRAKHASQGIQYII